MNGNRFAGDGTAGVPEPADADPPERSTGLLCCPACVALLARGHRPACTPGAGAVPDDPVTPDPPTGRRM
ncbi:hypothetical protein RKD28_002583 [Streptomyces sp. SAI-229]